MNFKLAFSRSELLLGNEYYNILKNKTVAVFGLGGVGGFAVEILARSGVGNLILIDGDIVDISNLNRQIIALHSTIGMPKTEVVEKRILDINPNCNVSKFQEFLLPNTDIFFDIFNSSHIDYVIDAVDTISLKVGLASFCFKNQIKIISAMGCGNRLNANFEFTDVFQTHGCPLCRVMRKRLKKEKVQELKVLYSPSPALRYQTPPASVSWVPSTAGIMLAGEIIKDLLNF